MLYSLHSYNMFMISQLNATKVKDWETVTAMWKVYMEFPNCIWLPEICIYNNRDFFFFTNKRERKKSVDVEAYLDIRWTLRMTSAIQNYFSRGFYVLHRVSNFESYYSGKDKKYS